MPTPVSIVRSARHRVGRAGRAARDGVHDLTPTRWTVDRFPRHQPAPAPSEFRSFGEDSWIVPPCRVRNPHLIDVGSGTVLMEGSALWALTADEGGDASSAGLVFGDGVLLGRWCSFISSVGIRLGHRVASSDGATILDSWAHPLAGAIPGHSRFSALGAGRVTIGDGAYLGFNCVVLPGVTIGEGAFIGENAVVDQDVPAFAVVRGNPATLQSRWDPATRQWTEVS